MPIPKPKTGEKQEDFISRCNSNLSNEFKDTEQRNAVCFNAWKKARKNQGARAWQLLEFHTPISESFVSAEDKFLIRGVAINETTTKNNHKFVAEELEKAAPGMIGKPILVDHNDSVMSIKGIIRNALFNPTNRRIEFEGEVMDEEIKKMISDGRLNKVSIGAFARDLIEEEGTGALIAKGIEIAELSFVAVPADPNADFAMAMREAFKIKSNSIEETITERRSREMAEKELENTKLLEEKEKQLKELSEKLALFEKKERDTRVAKYKSLCEEKKVTAKDVSKLSNEVIDLLIEQLEEVELPEEEAEEEKEEENTTEERRKTKSRLTEKEESELANFVVASDDAPKGFAVYQLKDYSVYKKLHANHPLMHR